MTGFVAELDPYFAEAALAVIPVRAGGGMRVRILEAFARAIPVVTTTVGLEGIQAEPGKDVLVADSPYDFANAVLSCAQRWSLADAAIHKWLVCSSRANMTGKERSRLWKMSITSSIRR